MVEMTPLFEVEKLLPILSEIAIFGGMDDKQLYKIFKVLKKTRYRDQEYIFRQGNPPTHIYIIIEGRVRMVEEIEGKSYQLFEFGPGNCIGEDSVIGIQPHTLTAVSIGDTELAVIPKASLLEFYESDKDIFILLILNIARELSRRLRLTDNLLLHYIDRMSEIGGGRKP